MRYIRVMPRLLMVFMTLFLLFVAVGGNTPAAPPAPAIAFVPPPEASYKSGDVTVSVIVSNFQIVNKQGQPSSMGEGHLLYCLDEDQSSVQASQSAVNTDARNQTSSVTHTFHGLASGVHRISAELINNDGTSLDPRVVAVLSVVAFTLPGVAFGETVHVPLACAFNH